MMSATEQLLVTIVAYEPKYAQAFAELNYEWLEKYFVVEPYDRQVLDAPEEHIMAPGGEILLALVNGRAIGTVALIKRADREYEVSKMAVTEQYKGLRIGQKLMYACIDFARKMGSTRIWLDSNRKLTPALNLYKKVGFKEIPVPAVTHYERGNIRMELFI